MKLAFSAPVRGDAEARQLFEQYRAVGYEGLQLKPGQYRGHLDKPHGLFEAWPTLRDGIAGLICGGRLDEQGQARLRQVFRFASAVRAPLVIFCHGEQRAGLDEADLHAYADQLDQLGREAQDAGTKLSLHHHHDQPCMHRADFDIFFGRPRAFGLTVDTAHLVKSGVQDVAEVIGAFRHAIDNFHIKDYAQGAFKVLGQGDIAFQPIFQAIRDIGYSGWVSADEESGGDVTAGMIACHRFLSEHLRTTTAADAL